MTRDRNEINVEILNAINRGVVGPTKIIYAAHISWATFTNRINGLIEKDLVEALPGPNIQSHTIYNLTEKGKKYIKAWNEIQGVLNE